MQDTNKIHNLILEGRNKLTLSGITDVDSFDEKTVVLFTHMGELTVCGNLLRRHGGDRRGISGRTITNARWRTTGRATGRTTRIGGTARIGRTARIRLSLDKSA